MHHKGWLLKGRSKSFALNVKTNCKSRPLYGLGTWNENKNTNSSSLVFFSFDAPRNHCHARPGNSHFHVSRVCGPSHEGLSLSGKWSSLYLCLWRTEDQVRLFILIKEIQLFHCEPVAGHEGATRKKKIKKKKSHVCCISIMSSWWPTQAATNWYVAQKRAETATQVSPTYWAHFSSLSPSVWCVRPSVRPSVLPSLRFDYSKFSLLCNKIAHRIVFWCGGQMLFISNTQQVGSPP